MADSKSTQKESIFSKKKPTPEPPGPPAMFKGSPMGGLKVDTRAIQGADIDLTEPDLTRERRERMGRRSDRSKISISIE